MSDNTLLNPGYGGDFIRTIDQGNNKTQVVVPAFLYVDGTITNSSAARPFPTITADTFVSLGVVTGFSSFRKFGRNSAIAANETYVATIGGTAPYMPTTAVTVEAISDSVNDTAAGSGAQTITIMGLDANFAEISETITMNGTSVTSPTTNSFMRVYRGYVSSVGTYRSNNAGIITIRASSSGTSFAAIGVGKGQTQGTHYCVPAGYKLIIRDVHFVVDSTKPVNGFFWQAPSANDVITPYSGAKRIIQDYTGLTGIVDFEYNPPMPFSEMTDLWVSATASGGGGGLSAEYNGYLVAL